MCHFVNECMSIWNHCYGQIRIFCCHVTNFWMDRVHDSPVIHDIMTTIKLTASVTGCCLITLVLLTAQYVNRALPAPQILHRPSPRPHCWEEVWANWTTCYRSSTPPSSTSQVGGLTWRLCICFYVFKKVHFLTYVLVLFLRWDPGSVSFF